MTALNDKIIAYFGVNNIAWSMGDYATGQPAGAADQIVRWNASALGVQPTQGQLDAAHALWFAQQAVAELKVHAAMRRWEKEQGGITLPGNVMVATDTPAQVKIAELRRRVASGEVAVPFSFKSASGWVDLNEATIIAVDQAVAAHIQDCYATEREVSDAIDAGTITTTAAIDAAFA